jgi:hypothetical protein
MAMRPELRIEIEAINDWNSQHASTESVVSLPVKWEIIRNTDDLMAKC